MAPTSELYDPPEHLGPRVLSRPLWALPPPHASRIDRLEELLLVRVYGRLGPLLRGDDGRARLWRPATQARDVAGRPPAGLPLPRFDRHAHRRVVLGGRDSVLHGECVLRPAPRGAGGETRHVGPWILELHAGEADDPEITSRLGETASEGRIEGIPRCVPCPWGAAPRSRPRTFVGPERWTGPVTISCAKGSPGLGRRSRVQGRDLQSHPVSTNRRRSARFMLAVVRMIYGPRSLRGPEDGPPAPSGNRHARRRPVLGRACARGDRSDANPTRRLLPPRRRDIGNRLPALSAAPTRTGSGFLHLPQASRKGPNEIRACEHSDRMVGGSARGRPLQRECDGLHGEGDPAVHPGARLVRDRPD